ncbi:hypothetical protein H9Q70_014599 [Fusarium xylarioides]|nr:hypothetical protein H9Q70_014599 [Fusarium xylarioides]KAG5765851.1 hypothetical protein H9Q73_014356 [Fusarium xylarioides]
MYIRVLSVFFCLFALAQCSPVESLFKRQGSCFSQPAPRPAPSQSLPAREIDVTANILDANTSDDLPWTAGDGTPGHVWRWRAWRSVEGRLAYLETEFYGYYGARVELRANAPAQGNQPLIAETSTGNVNGGGAAGWGSTMCLRYIGTTGVRLRGIQFVMHVQIGNMYPNLNT